MSCLRTLLYFSFTNLLKVLGAEMRHYIAKNSFKVCKYCQQARFRPECDCQR